MHGMQEVIGSTPIYSTKATVIRQLLFFEGVVAHLVEHLVRNQKVVGSSPIYSTRKTREHANARSFFDTRQASSVFRTGITINGPGIAINIILV